MVMVIIIDNSNMNTFSLTMIIFSLMHNSLFMFGE